MEDTKHFLAQNGLSGAVFFAFAIGYWLLSSPTEALQVFDTIVKVPNATALIGGIFVAVLAPIIGYSVQALVLVPFYLTRRSAYTDSSRQIIANALRNRIAAHPSISDTVKSEVCGIADDGMFVATYYQQAPERLIEWARRREILSTLAKIGLQQRRWE